MINILENILRHLIFFLSTQKNEKISERCLSKINMSFLFNLEHKINCSCSPAVQMIQCVLQIRRELHVYNKKCQWKNELLRFLTRICGSCKTQQTTEQICTHVQLYNYLVPALVELLIRGILNIPIEFPSELRMNFSSSNLIKDCNGKTYI